MTSMVALSSSNPFSRRLSKPCHSLVLVNIGAFFLFNNTLPSVCLLHSCILFRICCPIVHRYRFSFCVTYQPSYRTLPIIYGTVWPNLPRFSNSETACESRPHKFPARERLNDGKKNNPCSRTYRYKRKCRTYCIVVKTSPSQLEKMSWIYCGIHSRRPWFLRKKRQCLNHPSYFKEAQVRRGAKEILDRRRERELLRFRTAFGRNNLKKTLDESLRLESARGHTLCSSSTQYFMTGGSELGPKPCLPTNFNRLKRQTTVRKGRLKGVDRHTQTTLNEGKKRARKSGVSNWSCKRPVYG